jgi:L-ascorbate metabolism protein UlaG (beta-lactamase superfamily)
VRLTHVGGPTLLVEVDGWRLLTDPTFDAPGRRYDFGWGTSSRKLTGPALSVTQMGRLDAVLLTHDHHGDNLDDAGRAMLATAETVVTTFVGASRLSHAGLVEPDRVVGLGPWSTTVLEAPGRPPLEITATPCRHGPPLSRRVVGDVVGFAVGRSATAGRCLWISGDTVLFPGLREVAERLAVDTAVLHLGGVRFPATGPLRYTMNARDVVRLCGMLAPRIVIPVHYEGWVHFREGRAAAERVLDRAPGSTARRVRWLDPGVPTEIGAAPPG